jgi:PncC family amidohydrolase
MTVSGADLEELCVRLLDRLRGGGKTLATAESLTGGMLGAALTGVPGSSDAYVGGVVSYAIAVKTAVLSVPEAVIEDHGVVSAECAAAMAEGVRALTGADLALATTGVAGPGPQDGVAAGTVWVAVASSVGDTATAGLSLDGGRDDVRRGACFGALDLALNFQPLA